MSCNTDRITRYKMYKAKSRWLFTGMGVLLVSGAVLVGTQLTAQADTAADATPQTESTVSTGAATDQDTNVVALSSTQTDSQSVITAQKDYLNDKNRAYQTVTEQYQDQASQVTSDTADYHNNQADYEAVVDQYQTDVAANAPGYQTTSQATKNQLDDEYTAAQNKYDALVAQQTKINDTVNQANAALDEASQTLTDLYDQLPDSVKIAGASLAAYNDGVSDQAAQLVSTSTSDAYQTALQAQTGVTSHLATVLDQLPTITATTDETKIAVDPDTVKTVDGSVQATLYGETYTDNNGDGKITYEDDILPVITQNLQSDLTKAENDQTDDFTGSYAEVVTLFNYLKQVASMASPTVTADGEVTRVALKNADIGSDLLEQQMAPLLHTLNAVLATQYLKTIAGTQATVTQQVKTIDDASGSPFDGDALQTALNQTLLTQAITIYNAQTTDLLNNANQVLQAFQQVATAKDPLWQKTNTSYKLSQMIADLTHAISTTSQQVKAGKAGLTKLATSEVPVDDALSLVYSQGDTAAGFSTDQTLQSLRTNLSSTIAKLDTGMSSLLTDVQSTDPHATTDVSGNTVYSTTFVHTHESLFGVATALTDSITDLAKQSATITDNYQGVLQTLLKVPDELIVTLPVEQQQTMTMVTPMAPFDLQRVSLMKVNVSVHVNYVDDDNAGATVKTDTQTLQKFNGDTVNWTAQVPENYVLAARQRDAGTFKVGSSDTVQTVTIHLAHQHEVTKKTQKITTRFVPATADVDALQLPDDDVQTISWRVDHDLVTGQWTATPTKNKTKMVELPIVQGIQEDDQGGAVFYFVPTVTAINGVTVSAMTGKTDPTNSIKNLVRTVTYYKTQAAPDGVTKPSSAKRYPVEYVEIDGGQIEIIGEDVFTGKLGDTVTADAPLNYQLASKVSDTQIIDKNTGVIVFPVIVFGSEPDTIGQ